MAGALVLNPTSPFYHDLKQWQNLRYEDLLYEEDAVVLEKNSRDFTQRMANINRTTRSLVAWLQDQPQVERLYTPYTQPARWGEDNVQMDGAAHGGGLDSAAAHPPSANGASSMAAVHPALKAGAYPGFGGLFSVVLRYPELTSAPFYDAVRISKGPSLGNNFSLLCPYTLLAHYAELDWAESVGIHRFLLRFSIGLEHESDLRQRLLDALHAIDPIIREQDEKQRERAAAPAELTAVSAGGTAAAAAAALRA